MQSWNLEKFVAEFGYREATLIWGVSHQALYKAIGSARSIQVILMNGKYSIHESKQLGGYMSVDRLKMEMLQPIEGES